MLNINTSNGAALILIRPKQLLSVFNLFFQMEVNLWGITVLFHCQPNIYFVKMIILFTCSTHPKITLLLIILLLLMI